MDYKTPHDEIPTQRYTGAWIPVEIIDMFEAEEISSTEVLLLALVNSLVDKKRGCWASNEYLGRKMRLEAKSIGRLIGHLKELGLMFQVGFDGRQRCLETVWSRVETITATS